MRPRRIPTRPWLGCGGSTCGCPLTWRINRRWGLHSAIARAMKTWLEGHVENIEAEGVTGLSNVSAALEVATTEGRHLLDQLETEFPAGTDPLTDADQARPRGDRSRSTPLGRGVRHRLDNREEGADSWLNVSRPALQEAQVPLVRVRGQPFEALVGRTGPRGPACLRGPPWFPRAIRGRSSPGRRYSGLAEGWAEVQNALSI